jgi:hypothetical protein
MRRRTGCASVGLRDVEDTAKFLVGDAKELIVSLTALGIWIEEA